MIAALLIGIVALSVVGEPTVGQEGGEEAIAEQAVQETPPDAGEAAAAAPDLSVEEMQDEGLQDVLGLLAGSTSLPPDLQDPAFDFHVDLTLLGSAWVDLDAALLTDLALQFMEGERILLRPHRAVRSSQLLEIAIRLAAVKDDRQSLARLEKAVQRTKSEALARQFDAAKKMAADAKTDAAVWTIPVETTSAAVFARYKGFLQDTLAALVVRDRATLETLQNELADMAEFPEEHRTKLNDKIKAAIDALPDEQQEASAASKVLDKLAHSTREFGTARLSSTRRFPQGMGLLHRLATGHLIPSVSGGSPPIGTPQPSNPEITGYTRYPIKPTVCPPQSTSCPRVETRCPQNSTSCPRFETKCPRTPTRCWQITTTCPLGPECIKPTMRPTEPTKCQTIVTTCPLGPECIKPTMRPIEPTKCQTIVTTCPKTTACIQPTMHPVEPTKCQKVATTCPSKNCTHATYYPSVSTWCPAVKTTCPSAKTYCPGKCVPQQQQQQQQQKQRWIPRKGKSDYPEKPFSRREFYGPYH
jgi:hypothetical protein